MDSSTDEARAPHRPARDGSVDLRSVLALVAVQILFGLHYIAAKEVVATLPPQVWAVIRAGASAAILLSFVRVARLPFPRERGTLLRFAGLGLIGVAINQWLFVEGLHRTTPGHSALLNTTMPVIVLLLAVVLGRERPTVPRLLGIATTVAGVLILVKPEALDFGARELQGDLLTLVNSLSYSLFLVVGKPVLERERTIPATALLLGFGALWLAPLGLTAIGQVPEGAASPRIVLLGAFIVLGPTIAAYALNTYALKRVPSSVVAFFIYLQPVIGAGLSIALGYERVTAKLVLAAAVVFLGVFVALRAPDRSPGPRPASGLAGSPGD